MYVEPILALCARYLVRRIGNWKAHNGPNDDALSRQHEYAPEVAVQSYPEAVPQQHPQVYNVQGQQQAQQQPYYAPDAKPTYPPTVSSPPPTTTTHSPYQASHANLASENGNGGVGGGEEKRRGGGGADRTVCGCTLIVFVLSVIIAVLAAGVIGLAAGTGIEASRASEASDSYQRLQASVSAAGLLAPSGTGSAPAAASGTSCPRPETVVIDNGCASNSSSVSGQSYTSFKLLSLATYTMQCNKDVNGTVLYSLFAPDFNSCMDSCSGYTKYATDFFGTTNVNATCAGVSFIPLWTNKTIALAGGAPGNCYLKRGPLEKKAFIVANAGTPVHGAIVDGGSG
ncbi:hypothetical protein RB601_002401 [Gaeumannomyces tritici]